MASSERLQNEILLKEEAFLKEQRAKLTEQLNKLKVRCLLSRDVQYFQGWQTALLKFSVGAMMETARRCMNDMS